MTIFLFGSVFVSGLKIISSVDINSRRNRFILTMSMCIGVGVIIVPFAFADQAGSPYTMNFWPCNNCGETAKGFRDGVSIFLSTGYCVGPVIAVLLNAILPIDNEVVTKAMLDDIKKLSTDDTFHEKDGINSELELVPPTASAVEVGQSQYMEVRGVDEA